MAKPTVLIVEDSPDISQPIADALRFADFKTLQAYNAVQGLQFASEHRPDLILMDMQLPRVDGYEATRRIKADDRLRSVPLVAITAHSMKRDEDRAHEAGCDRFISKPVEADGLLALVRELVGG